MLFNRAVRECVDRSDPDTMRRILRDPANKNYALDATVLETVMKAYVMAAMFEDALYCLRHCTLPGTLSAHQTERILTCLPQNLRNYSSFVASWFFVRWRDRFYCKQRKNRNENGSKLNVLIITKLVIFYYMKLIQLVVFREMHLWRLICCIG